MRSLVARPAPTSPLPRRPRERPRVPARCAVATPSARQPTEALNRPGRGFSRSARDAQPSACVPRGDPVAAGASVRRAREKRPLPAASSAARLSWTASRPASTIPSRAALTRASRASIRRRRSGSVRRSCPRIGHIPSQNGTGRRNIHDVARPHTHSAFRRTRMRANGPSARRRNPSIDPAEATTRPAEVRWPHDSAARWPPPSPAYARATRCPRRSAGCRARACGPGSGVANGPGVRR